MRTLRGETANAIASDLNRASGRQIQGTGGVYCLERNWECVPFTYGSRTLLLEFGTPYYLTQVQFYSTILFKTKSGGYFVPKLEFRNISLSYLTDDNALAQLCMLPSAELTANQTALADAIRNALIVYYRSYPNANQYFYQFQASTEDLLKEVCTIPPALQERYALENYLDLAAPWGGFSLTSKSL